MIDAKKVLRFWEEHFDNIKILYKIDKKYNSITEDDIKIFDNNTVRDNLIEYKIIEKRFNEEYIFIEVTVILLSIYLMISLWICQSRFTIS